MILEPCPEDVLPPVLPSHAPAVAAWVWLGLIVAVIVFEWWAIRSRHQTLSQWLGKWSGRWRWLKWFSAGVLAFAWWHWFL